MGLIWKLWSSTRLILPAAFPSSLVLGLTVAENMGDCWVIEEILQDTCFWSGSTGHCFVKNQRFLLDPLTKLSSLSLVLSDTKLNKCKNMNSKEMPRPDSIMAERCPASLISVAAPDLFPYQ